MSFNERSFLLFGELCRDNTCILDIRGFFMSDDLVAAAGLDDYGLLTSTMSLDVKSTLLWLCFPLNFCGGSSLGWVFSIISLSFFLEILVLAYFSSLIRSCKSWLLTFLDESLFFKQGDLSGTLAVCALSSLLFSFLSLCGDHFSYIMLNRLRACYVFSLDVLFLLGLNSSCCLYLEMIYLFDH